MGRRRKGPRKTWPHPPTGADKWVEAKVHEDNIDAFFSCSPESVNDDKTRKAVSAFFSDDPKLGGKQFKAKMTKNTYAVLKSYKEGVENSEEVMSDANTETYKQERAKKLRGMYEEWLANKGTDFGVGKRSKKREASSGGRSETSHRSTAEVDEVETKLSMLNLDTFLSTADSADKRVRSAVSRFFSDRLRPVPIKVDKSVAERLAKSTAKRYDELKEMDEETKKEWTSKRSKALSELASEWAKGSKSRSRSSSKDTSKKEAKDTTSADISLLNLDTYLSTADASDTDTRTAVSRFFSENGESFKVEVSKAQADELQKTTSRRHDRLEKMDDSKQKQWRKKRAKELSRLASKWKRGSKRSSSSSKKAGKSKSSSERSSSKSSSASASSSSRSSGRPSALPSSHPPSDVRARNSNASNWGTSGEPISWNTTPSSGLVSAAA